MEALRLLRHPGLGAIEADGGGGVGGSLGIGNLAGEHYAALNGLGKYGLARLWVLIPAKCLPRQKRVAEPLESDEGVSATLGLGQRRAQFFHPGVEVGGNLSFLAVIFFAFIAWVKFRPRRANCARSRLGIVGAFEVDANFVLLRRPGFRGGVASLAAAVLTT